MTKVINACNGGLKVVKAHVMADTDDRQHCIDRSIGSCEAHQEKVTQILLECKELAQNE